MSKESAGIVRRDSATKVAVKQIEGQKTVVSTFRATGFVIYPLLGEVIPGSKRAEETKP